ncbi:UNVERIFIED_CONTAM: hypothetical protein GTU68_062995 [Idotea baltica]|nr:hypothetical protein [Idotea baltica]
MAENRAIGFENELPWHLPADMRYFMRTTKNHHVLMGRKTFESLGNPLKNRTNIVITRDPFFVASGTIVVHSLHEAISIAESNGEEEAFIIGGAQIYALSMPLLNRIYLTEIELQVDQADAYFPPVNEDIWKVVSEERHEPDEKNKYPFAFKIFEKK